MLRNHISRASHVSATRAVIYNLIDKTCNENQFIKVEEKSERAAKPNASSSNDRFSPNTSNDDAHQERILTRWRKKAS